MKTVTAATPEPDDDIDVKAAKVLRYANNKRIEAERNGHAFSAAFWTGFRRSFARRWYKR